MEDTLLLLLLLLLLPNTCGRTSIHPNTRTHITGRRRRRLTAGAVSAGVRSLLTLLGLV